MLYSLYERTEEMEGKPRKKQINCVQEDMNKCQMRASVRRHRTEISGRTGK